MDYAMLLTNYIWTPDWTPEDRITPRIVCFRKAVTAETPMVRRLRITADSRYKLYVNDVFLQKGPQKPLDGKEWFVDTAALSLVPGENVIAVEVLRYPASTCSASAPNTNDSLLPTEIPHLYVEDLDAAAPALGGKTGWKCRVRREVSIVGEEARPAPIHAQEQVTATSAFAGWKCPGYDASDWQDAVPRLIFDVPMADAPGNLVERTIPQMQYEDCRFVGVSAIRSGGDVAGNWEGLILRDEPVTVPAHSVQIVELSAGEEVCGYLRYTFAGGAGAKITTLCSECYAYSQPEQPSPWGGMVTPAPKKGDRTDATNGQLLGHTSHYIAAGYGTAEGPEDYEPFWFRTFRYIRLTVETGEEPLTLLGFTYRATGYPLEVKTRFAVSDPTMAPIWDICVRTLRRCMHETYMDCPFYEQLQYAMDGRSEILYTYAVSADDRLARQAMEAFRRSQRPDGLVNADAPTAMSNVIPCFSIYYLLMVHDHMMYFGDRALVRRHLNAIEQILSFFHGHLNENGIVGKLGGILMRERYWSFIDWSEKWDSGVPRAGEGGSITVESLLYLYGLQKAAELADFAARPGLGAEYRSRAEALKTALLSHCMGDYRGRRLVQDGPGVEAYSVHAQVFAILTGLVSPQEGRAMLETTVGNPDMAQSSVAFMFYLFRALEVSGWYEKTDELWNLWRQMVDNHMTTCVENDTDQRSDCHAWAALLCYELPAVVLGVRPAAPGFEKVKIAPQMGALTHAQGNVITPKGFVHVAWRRRADGSCDLSCTLPEGMEAV